MLVLGIGFLRFRFDFVCEAEFPDVRQPPEIAGVVDMIHPGFKAAPETVDGGAAAPIDFPQGFVDFCRRHHLSADGADPDQILVLVVEVRAHIFQEGP